MDVEGEGSNDTVCNRNETLRIVVRVQEMKRLSIEPEAMVTQVATRRKEEWRGKVK